MFSHAPRPSFQELTVFGSVVLPDCMLCEPTFLGHGFSLCSCLESSLSVLGEG